MEIKDFAKQMIGKFGDLQLIIACEELSELQKEICKYLRNKGDKDHIKEEMADVQLMLDELKVFFDISQEEIYRIKRKKILRTQKRCLENIEEIEKEEKQENDIFDLMEENDDK